MSEKGGGVGIDDPPNRDRQVMTEQTVNVCAGDPRKRHGLLVKAVRFSFGRRDFTVRANFSRELPGSP